MPHLRPFRPFCKSEFTLIELLVVIAIIALLAAILFPVFSRARENARRSSCLSNMKQMGLGISQYTQDYDERLPLALAENYSWSKRIFPYVKSDGVYSCPDVATKPTPSVSSSNGYYVSYGCNDNIMTSGSARSISEIANASGTSVLAEANRFTTGVQSSPVLENYDLWPDYIDTARSVAQGAGNVDYQWRPPGCWDRSFHEATTGASCSAGNPYYSNTAATSNLFRPVPRHFNGLNVAYADGHAKWITMAQFVGPMPEGWAYGNPNNSWENQ